MGWWVVVLCEILLDNALAADVERISLLCLSQSQPLLLAG